MKKNYMKPLIDVDNMLEQDLLTHSLQLEATTADDSEVLGREGKSIWDDEE